MVLTTPEITTTHSEFESGTWFDGVSLHEMYIAENRKKTYSPLFSKCH